MKQTLQENGHMIYKMLYKSKRFSALMNEIIEVNNCLINNRRKL